LAAAVFQGGFLRRGDCCEEPPEKTAAAKIGRPTSPLPLVKAGGSFHTDSSWSGSVK